MIRSGVAAGHDRRLQGTLSVDVEPLRRGRRQQIWWRFYASLHGLLKGEQGETDWQGRYESNYKKS